MTPPAAPPLIRRSSHEPMHLGLASLPPPIFSRAPPGQRSVPAVDVLAAGLSNGSSTLSRSTSLTAGSDGVAPASSSLAKSTGGPVLTATGLVASGATTPGAGLGNGSLNTEPWNLWADETSPSANSALITGAGTGASDTTRPINGVTANQQRAPSTDDLASIFAASLVLGGPSATPIQKQQVDHKSPGVSALTTTTHTNGRRDSGYGLSSYISPTSKLGGSLLDERRGSRHGTGALPQQEFPAGHSTVTSPYPYPLSHTASVAEPVSSFNHNFFSSRPLGNGVSIAGFGGLQPSHQPPASTSPSLMRYPFLGGSGVDFLSVPGEGIGSAGLGLGIGFGGVGTVGAGAGTRGYAGLQNYGVGFVGSISPYAGFDTAFNAGGGNVHSHASSYDRTPPRSYEEKSRPLRSPLLEEFRADKLKRWGVKDMADHIAEFMCDQVGSRYIQESILEHPTSEDCDLIFAEVHPVVTQLATDVFANFCVQKLFEKASPQQVDMLVVNLRGSILRLSLQTYGCRVIQKALEVVSRDKQYMILHELEGSVQKCVRDQNANHVIQKVVTTCSPEMLQFVVDAFIGSVYTFATHPYSCRVLQRMLENCPEKMKRPLLEELKSYAQNLMQDQYGNYVIQYCLDRGIHQDKSDIIVQIYGQVLHFSKHKFASNVIEKCIMNANEVELNLLASEVLAPGLLDGTTGIQAMLKHEFANYPLQRLIKHTTGTIHNAIIEQVTMQLAMFRQANPPFQAKHLVAVEKLLVDISPSDFPSLLPRRFEDHYVSRLR